ncbi:hypothetical protein H6F44_20630 [Pseudanabaena sp. FACHB-1277]|uniref:Uncharacterized protein n=1 Tax=Pseudanabaena cinerea FACHB-1277 TaxID=2949581 RepID=A0A926UWV6_9CYAN|nr:hypothetical protein [Pseudanabaena cinerea]MBD2152504.1 hypothetical protein [Pseudanabaena cinerea FACHB-1277]
MAISEAERERRRQQCLKTKPWQHSTGAKTPEGKLRVSQNALKTGLHSQFEPIRLLARLDLQKENFERIKAIVQSHKQAYENCETAPHPHWQELFEHLDDDDFLDKLLNYRV